MSISVGDQVRSFDFSTGPGGRDLEGERACYVEGRVEELVVVEGCLRYRIAVERDVFGGEESERRVGSEVFPPINGTATLFGDDTDFVEFV